MDKLKDTKERLAGLQAKRKMWQPSGGPEYSKLVTQLFSFDLLDELCSIYLDPNTTAEEREEIRALAWNDANIMGQLLAYIRRAAGLLRSTLDIKWLRLGLAAASIENLQLDYRDTYTLLGALYTATMEIGIDPAPHFETVAGISSDQPDSEKIATRDFLLNFDKSAYFLESVNPTGKL